MAKELPYFKFEPNQWENGNIQICSREDKGLFMDLCSMYWSRLGDLPFKLAVNKLCGGNASAFDSLMRENIFTVVNDLICIDYLNEQLSNFDETSKTNSKNAREGWEKRRRLKEESERNATALNPQCENDAIREEEKREEKRIKEEIDFSPFGDDFKIHWITWLAYKKSQFRFTYKQLKTEQMAFNDLVKKSNTNKLNAIAIINNSMVNGWKGLMPLKEDFQEPKSFTKLTENLNSIPKDPYELFTT